MAKWYIMEKPDKSERCITQDKSGHEGWTEIGTSTREPSDDEEWDGKKWAVNTVIKAKRERASKVSDCEGMLAMIEALQATVAALETRVATLEGGV